MRSPMPAFPVDRYLVQSNIDNELVNIINEDIWNPEPTLRPEDEITLRKLHEMLRSTADDLRLLSGELAKHHQSGIQVKTTPTPLDEEFNEKVHIEEVVNAKFHGYKIIDRKNTFTPSKNVQKDVVDGLIKTIADKQKRKHVVTTGVQVNEAPIKKITNKNMVKTQTKVLQVNNGKENNKNNNKSNNLNEASSIGYNEFSYKYIEPKSALQMKKNLQLQELPKINIRSELKVQHVLQLDILPDNSSERDLKKLRDNNTTVLVLKYESNPTDTNAVDNIHKIKPDTLQSHPLKKPLDRKISKMETCESSESTEHLFAEIQRKTKLQRQVKRVRHTSPAVSARNKAHAHFKLDPDKQERAQTSLNEWKKKLNSVYGRPSTSKLVKQPHLKTRQKTRSTTHKKITNFEINNKNGRNNAEYIPYSKLTLGGVNVSDIEKEISNIADKGEMLLGPILEKMLSSRENSIYIESPRIHKKANTKNVLTTSDENLLKEVMDIQNKVSNTLSENVEKISLSNGENDTYADDFDDEKTASFDQFSQQSEDGNGKSQINEDSSKESNKNSLLTDEEKIDNKIKNETFIKSNSLSFKNSVDIFEYVHEINTQDSATQINMSNKISLKETQTSPTSDKNNIQSIHNDLRPSTDPLEEVEEMFKLEKEFIKKLIIDEYGNLLEKTVNKPSTSSNLNEISEINENSSQKNTQTSPAHVKSVMTSPTRTKTRTTSPLVLLSKVNQHTSPMTIPSNDEEDVIQKNDTDKSSISMNLSSPRFSLRLPLTSRDVISNLDTKLHRKDHRLLSQNRTNLICSSSSSVDGDYSSSDISSLGEIEKHKRMYRKLKLSTTSDQSSSTTPHQNSELSNEMLPLRSEGEITFGQIKRKVKKQNKASKSEGELSLGELLRRAKK